MGGAAAHDNYKKSVICTLDKLEQRLVWWLELGSDVIWRGGFATQGFVGVNIHLHSPLNTQQQQLSL